MHTQLTKSVALPKITSTCKKPESNFSPDIGTDDCAGDDMGQFTIGNLIVDSTDFCAPVCGPARERGNEKS